MFKVVNKGYIYNRRRNKSIWYINYKGLTKCLKYDILFIVERLIRKGDGYLVSKGRLYLSHKNDDYIVFEGGRNTNLSDYFRILLLERVKFKLIHSYTGQVLVDVEGKLYKDKIQPKYYTWHVETDEGNVDIDDVLWNLVGNKVIIELKNINK